MSSKYGLLIDLVHVVHKEAKTLSPELRVLLFRALEEGFCWLCGHDEPDHAIDCLDGVTGVIEVQ